MITIHADIIVKKEFQAAMLTSLHQLIEESVKEDGCAEYRLVAVVSNPLHYKMVEQWESENALKQHEQTPHFKSFVSEVGSWLEAPIKLTLFNNL